MIKLRIIFPILVFTLVLIPQINSQTLYSRKIDSLINQVSIQQLLDFNKEITGETTVLIGGVPKRITTRYEGTQGNQLAAQYLYEKFESYGLSTKYQTLGNEVYNVIGWKTGTKYPNKYFLIGAHYDNKIEGSSTDTIYGADDNGTGICVLLELARLIQGFNTDYSIAFVAFNFEETSGKGSMLYADSSRIRGDSLMGVLNAEMLGYDGNGDNKITVITNPNSDMLSSQFISSLINYHIDLIPIKLDLEFGADHISFWKRNFKAITTSEYIGDLTPSMHKITDRWFNLTPSMFEKLTKANVATFLSWATGNYFEIQHNPLQSTYDTASQTVTAEIIMPYPISDGGNSPKLYYRINGGSYTSIDAFEVNGITYKFSIPGESMGTKISYYIAAQDSSGIISVTVPFGGGGINPPGNLHPQNLNVYYILTSNTYSSVTTPKIIFDGATTQDTIHINQTGNVVAVSIKLNVLHQNNAEINVDLKKLKQEANLIPLNVCTGSNFINTNFSDTAELKITQGSAPYTGNFRAIDPLSNFKNTEMQGDWILSISDKYSGISGTLTGWSLTIIYERTVSIHNQTGILPTEYKLYQNYPNPFNPTTKIKYQILKSQFVKLEIYDILGQRLETLINEKCEPGSYEIPFDGGKLSSGVYFYKLTTDNFTATKRMILVK